MAEHIVVWGVFSLIVIIYLIEAAYKMRKVERWSWPAVVEKARELVLGLLLLIAIPVWLGIGGFVLIHAVKGVYMAILEEYSRMQNKGTLHLSLGIVAYGAIAALVLWLGSRRITRPEPTRQKEPQARTIEAETGTYEVRGRPASLTVTRAAETWQFFAFVFAAVVTLALALVDEIPNRLWPWRVAGKLLAFGGLTYLMLWPTSRVRGWLSTLLGAFKQERR